MLFTNDMKPGTVIYNKIVWLSSFVLLAILFISVSAQSRRYIPPPQPEASPQTTLPKRADTKSDFAVDPNADKYKLVFSTSFEGTLITVGEERANQGRRSRLDNFVEHLNKASS